jgi:flagella basal body P-ring formation protein FlgA
MLWLPTSASLAHQESRLVSQAIEDFLKIQTQGLPGQISYAVTPLDPRNKLTPCKDFSVSLIPGGRLWGRTSVMVSCQNENGWKIHVPVRISVHSDYLVTARPLSQGQVINENDLTHNHGDLTTLPDGLLTDARQAIGRSTVQSLPAGRPLRGDLLRQAAAVHQGQNVKVRATGPGFQVTGGDGRALNTAADGQVVQVRMANGHIVNGIGRAGGIVEVSY